MGWPMIRLINRIFWLPRLPVILIGHLIMLPMYFLVSIIVADIRVMGGWWDRQDLDNGGRTGVRATFRSWPR
jgi:hypothetical protein